MTTRDEVFAYPRLTVLKKVMLRLRERFPKADHVHGEMVWRWRYAKEDVSGERLARIYVYLTPAEVAKHVRDLQAVELLGAGLAEPMLELTEHAT